jgi:hypothetical protein
MEYKLRLQIKQIWLHTKAEIPLNSLNAQPWNFMVLADARSSGKKSQGNFLTRGSQNISQWLKVLDGACAELL